jgi:hypothetical protein
MPLSVYRSQSDVLRFTFSVRRSHYDALSMTFSSRLIFRYHRKTKAVQWAIPEEVIQIAKQLTLHKLAPLVHGSGVDSQPKKSSLSEGMLRKIEHSKRMAQLKRAINQTTVMKKRGSRHVTPRHATPRHATSHHITSRHVTSLVIIGGAFCTPVLHPCFIMFPRSLHSTHPPPWSAPPPSPPPHPRAPTGG